MERASIAERIITKMLQKKPKITTPTGQMPVVIEMRVLATHVQPRNVSVHGDTSKSRHHVKTSLNQLAHQFNH